MELTNNDNEEMRWNSYFYPGTQTLKNKLNIIDAEMLKQKEAEISFEKLVELYENPIVGNFDSQHLKDIHKYIFEDLYDWAGEYRYVNMQKQTGFTDYNSISEYLSGELKLMNEEFLQVDSLFKFAMFLSTYYVQLMAIHPFREGNGRTAREFLREFVLEKSKSLPFGPLELDWTRFNGNVVLDNITYALAFRSLIDMEFQKALVSPEDKNQIKM